MCMIMSWIWVCVCNVNMWVCVHIGSETYLCGNHKFFFTSIKRRDQIKVDQRLKKFHHAFMGLLETVVCRILYPVLSSRKSRNRNVSSGYIIGGGDSTTRRDKRLLQKVHKWRASDREERTRDTERRRSSRLLFFKLRELNSRKWRRHKPSFLSYELLPLVKH